MSSMKGFLYGIASSATFGLIPLFTLPLMSKGMVFDSILFYRFLIASFAIGILLIIRKETFLLSRKEIPILALLGCLYAGSALFLFWGYNYLSSGIATTIHFLYPVFVTLIMISIFHEKKSFWTIFAVLLAFSGVALLSLGDGETQLSIKGIFIVIISSVSYALYITGVNKSSVHTMKGLKITFYVLLFGAILFFCMAQLKGNFQWIPDSPSLFNILSLAIVPTVISNLTLVNAVKYIGSTLTSVLGAMEPLTAVCTGIIVFHEPLTTNLAIGIICIISAVSIIILSKQLNKITIRLRYAVTHALLKRAKDFHA